MFYLRENTQSPLFEVVYAGRVVLTFTSKEQAQAQVDRLNGKSETPTT